MITWNKWERSELYVFLKLLIEKKLNLWDRYLNILDIEPLEFYWMIKNSWNKKIIYRFDEETNKIQMEWDNWFISDIEIVWLKNIMNRFYSNILKNANTTFENTEVINAMNLINITNIKQSSKIKSDIVGIVYDRDNQINIEAGFSIKSSLWWLSTLLNASMHTNFKYKVIWLSDNTINEINKQHVIYKENWKTSSNIQKLIKDIYAYWWSIVFCKWENSNVFENNLKKIDLMMPDLIWEILKDPLKNIITS